MNKRFKLLKFILFIVYFIVFANNFYYSLISILVICIHELGHLLFLKIKNVGKFDFKISFLGFKIDLKYKIIENEIFTYISGSLVNIIVGLIFLILKIFIPIKFLNDFAIVNLVIGFFNLIPAVPLDGAMILKKIMLKRFKYNIAMLINVVLSFFFATIMALICIYLYFKNNYFNITYIVVSIFVFISIYREYKIFLSMYSIKGIDYKKYVILKKKYFKTKVVCVCSNINLFELIKLCKFSKFLVFYFVDENLNFVGIMNEYNVLECYKKFGNIKISDYYKK